MGHVRFMIHKGYGILPNTVLFDEQLSSTAKLLFVLISSLCAEKGYCYANNKYLADKLDLSESSVSKHIATLENYIIITNPHNHQRQISLAENYKAPSKKLRGSLVKNYQHNNTSSNTINKGRPVKDEQDPDIPLQEVFKTNFKPPSKKKGKHVLAQAKDICQMFTEYRGGVYTNTIHLGALVDLLQLHGIDRVTEVSKFALELKPKEYQIQVNKPVDLADHWSKIVDLMEKPEDKKEGWF